MLSPYILLTALTAQFFYILVNWIFLRRREYLYYSLYAFVLALYFLNQYVADPDGFHHFFSLRLSKQYPDKILCILSYLLYFKFGRHFIEAQTRYPSIDRLMVVTEKLLLLYIVIDCILLFSWGLTTFENILFIVVNLGIFSVLIFVFYSMIRRNEPLDRFILTGSMFYGIAAFFTMWLGFDKPQEYTAHFLPLQIGGLVEMVFLNAGLVYKSRLVQRQTIRSKEQLIERYKENENLLLKLATLRERISRDLHDDVGATLSSIKIYSEILKSNPQNPLIAELISKNSTEMIESLEVMAWSTNPEHDHFRSLKNMMLKFAVPLCHAKNIEFNLDYETIDEELPMPGETRQNIYMIFKECINNMIKYSEATACNVKGTIYMGNYLLSISDNGNGIGEIIRGNGNGLNNINKRAGEMNGEMQVESSPERGTMLTLRLPYPFSDTKLLV